MKLVQYKISNTDIVHNKTVLLEKNTITKDDLVSIGLSHREAHHIITFFELTTSSYRYIIEL